jgi:hypothetical protein
LNAFVAPFIHEDVPWTTDAPASERLMYDATPGYYYRQRVRRFEPQASDRRLLLVIDSSLHNARCLDRIAAGLRGDPELQRLLRWQLVDGALSIFHKLRQFHSAQTRRECQRRLRRERLQGCLGTAVDLRQKRRIPQLSPTAALTQMGAPACYQVNLQRGFGGGGSTRLSSLERSRRPAFRRCWAHRDAPFLGSALAGQRESCPRRKSKTLSRPAARAPGLRSTLRARSTQSRCRQPATG